MILVDLDNCLSDDSWRIPLVKWEHDNLFLRYHPYHMAIPGDNVANGHMVTTTERVVITTSRPVQYKWLTRMWLDYHKINYAALLMREREDGELTSPEVKRKAVQTIRRVQPGTIITMAYDDRPDVIAMYQQEGIPAQHVAIHTYEWKEWYGKCR